MDLPKQERGKMRCKACDHSRQWYNGRPYCMRHHPQSQKCASCGALSGKILMRKTHWVCENCVKEALSANGVQLSFDWEI